MNDQQPPVAAVTEWTMKKILPMFAIPQRWKILLFLADKGPQPASALPGAQTRSGRSVVLKQLAAMRRAGMILKTENSRDGRKSLYSLAPTLPVRRTEDGIEMDFDFVLFRLRYKSLEMTSRPREKQTQPVVVPTPTQPVQAVNPMEKRIAELERLVAQLSGNK